MSPKDKAQELKTKFPDKIEELKKMKAFQLARFDMLSIGELKDHEKQKIAFVSQTESAIKYYQRVKQLL